MLDLGDPEVLTGEHACGLADILDHGDGHQATFLVADREGGAGIGPHVDLAGHHLLHRQVTRRHRKLFELDAMLFQQAGAQQIIGRHAPHVGLVTLAHRFERQGGPHAESCRQHPGAGCRQHMAAGHSLVRNRHRRSSL